MEHIAIIGSGFCGTALAAQLLRRAGAPLQLTLINRSGPIARGLAYGTHSAYHLLNVPAERMSLFPDKPGDFVEFARTRLPDVRPGDFLPRSLYGDYLQKRLAQAIAERHPAVTFKEVNRHAVDIETLGGELRLTLDNRERLAVSHAVIATGNFAPVTPPPLLGLNKSPHYICDPWRKGALDPIPAQARTLLLGTGLTMYDMALALKDQGHHGSIQALSRRALLPQAHRSNARHPALPALPKSILEPQRLRHLVRKVRRFIDDSAAQGYDWRDAISALRPITPGLWQMLGDGDRARFLRHLQPYWDVHRHRAAPEVAQRIADLCRGGQLAVHAGRIVSAEEMGDDLQVDIRLRGQKQVESRRFDVLINCTGPCSDLMRANEPLFDALLGRGALQQDPHLLGLCNDASYRLLDRQGRAHPNLFLLSPMLRAGLWECTAVPELREHAERLSRQLLDG